LNDLIVLTSSFEFHIFHIHSLFVIHIFFIRTSLEETSEVPIHRLHHLA
jgi:hypothetical protein